MSTFQSNTDSLRCQEVIGVARIRYISGMTAFGEIRKIVNEVQKGKIPPGVALIRIDAIATTQKLTHESYVRASEPQYPNPQAKITHNLLLARRYIDDAVRELPIGNGGEGLAVTLCQAIDGCDGVRKEIGK